MQACECRARKHSKSVEDTLAKVGVFHAFPVKLCLPFTSTDSLQNPYKGKEHTSWSRSTLQCRV